MALDLGRYIMIGIKVSARSCSQIYHGAKWMGGNVENEDARNKKLILFLISSIYFRAIMNKVFFF